MVQQLQSKPAEQQPPIQEQPNAPPALEQSSKGIDLYKLSRELSIWESKCLKALKRGESADSTVFITETIPVDIYNEIQDGLKSAKNADEVKAIFKQATAQPQSEEKVIMPDSGLFALAVELRRANDLLEMNEQAASA
jgi:hypothetical protein